MTAREAYMDALALLDEIESTGEIPPDTEEAFGGKIHRIINIVQREIAHIEGSQAVDISDLDDELSISDDSSKRIMPLGLASHLALADDLPDLYRHYYFAYQNALNTIAATEEDIVDVYDITRGMT